MARAVRVEFRGAFYHLMARGDSSGADCAGRRGSSDLRPHAGGSQRAEQVSGARLRADEQPLPSSFGDPASQSFPGYEMAAERLHAEDQYPTRALGPSLWRPLQSDPGRAGKPLPGAARFHSPQSGAGGDCCGEGWPRILCLETPWLETATGLEVCECGDTASGRREFLDLLERRVDWHNPRLAGTTFPEGNGQPQLAVYSSLCRGWLFGSEHFREKLLRMLAKRPTRIEKANGYHGPQLNDFAEKARSGTHSGSPGTLWHRSRDPAAGSQGRLAKRAACGDDSERNHHETGLDYGAAEHGNPRGNLPPCRRSPKTSRRRSRLEEGDRNNSKDRNIKWLTPFSRPSRINTFLHAIAHSAESNVRLLQHGLRRLLLLVRRIAVLAQDALHQHAQLGADVLAQRPVDRDVARARSRPARGAMVRRVSSPSTFTALSFVSSAS